MPGVSVSPLVIVPVAIFAAVFFLIVVRAAMRLRHRTSTTRDEQLIGLEESSCKTSIPPGSSRSDVEHWTAEAVRGTPCKGDRVRVVQMEGLKLKVEPTEAPATSAAEGQRGGETSVILLVIGIGVVVLLLILIVPMAIKIVREYQRLMVFRLGRAIGAKGPGLVLLIPFVDKAWVDLRELYLEIPHQAAITEDNATISIDFIVFYRGGRADVGGRGRQLRRRGPEHRRDHAAFGRR